MNEIINVADIVEENGKTVRQNNMAKTHNIPEGALVEVKHQKWYGGGACSKIHARLFVAYLERDCDGTPLYYLSEVRRDKWEKVSLVIGSWKLNEDMSQRIYYDVVGGFPESSLTVIEVTPEIEAGKDALIWPSQLFISPKIACPNPKYKSENVFLNTLLDIFECGDCNNIWAVK